MGKMRKVIVTMWVSVDGFIAGPNDEMDWITNIFDAAMGQYEDDIVNQADTLLLGRITYQSFAGAWPNVPDNAGVSEDERAYARKLNAMRKIVFSRTLKTVEWNNSKLVRENIAAEVLKLKQSPGKDLLIYGSASIVQELTNAGLIDEYQLLIHPVILGSGKPLFKNLKDKTNLTLAHTQTYPSGVVLLIYQLKK
jgi:dihydrofolate reductase